MGRGKGPCENVAALGPGDNVHRAWEEALGRAAVSDLKTSMAAPRPSLWGPPRGNHQPGGRGAFPRQIRHKHWEALAGGWVPPWAEEAGDCDRVTRTWAWVERHVTVLSHSDWEPTGCLENGHTLLGCEPEHTQGTFARLWFPKGYAQFWKKYEYVF